MYKTLNNCYICSDWEIICYDKVQIILVTTNFSG